MRLRVLVDDGALSVAGAKFVEGPLAETNALHPGLAYEVRLGSRSIAAGGVADGGVWRSFPDPLGRPGLQGHHIAEVPSYEIAVRIPVQKLSISALPKAQITLYRWRGTGPAMALAGQPLKSQLKGPVETVATLKGIRMSQLSKEAQTELPQGAPVASIDISVKPEGHKGSGPRLPCQIMFGVRGAGMNPNLFTLLPGIADGAQPPMFWVVVCAMPAVGMTATTASTSKGTRRRDFDMSNRPPGESSSG